MTPQQFSEAVARGMRASPFASSAAAPLILISGTVRKSLSGCLVSVSDNKEQADEYGLQHAYIIKAHIPKSQVPAKPDTNLAALEYQGRKYNLVSASGDEEYSPVWVVEGSSPIKL